MTGSRVSLSCYFALAATLSAVLASLAGSLGAQTRTGDITPETQNQAPFRLRATSNLVVVRVVVRDQQGKPVENLKKEDFTLFDRGKEQSITQFEVQTAPPPASSAPVAVGVPGQAAPGPPPARPGRFLALYFDDLDSSAADLFRARDAADLYLAAHLQPKDRVAIFTSTQMLSDFTADPKRIHDALSKLHLSPRATRSHDCPDLSDYQAREITENPNDHSIDAWVAALAEAAGRGCGSAASSAPIILMEAQNVIGQAEVLARTNLQELDQMVKYIAQMPGQRTMVLVSPGFLSQSEQYQLDRMIDRALRSQVVISSLDPKGLALIMREADVTLNYMPPALVTHSLDSSRESAVTDVLAEIAQGTGGEFFRNNNDLKAGFGALAGSPVYYLLAFSPTDIKPNGKFHALKVSLAEKRKGISIQARRDYFAPKSEAAAETEAKTQTSEAEAAAQEQIREAILSDTKVRQLPVALKGKVSGVMGQRLKLSLFVHLDAKPLHFHKEGVHNLNTVTFVFAVFDQKENMVDSQQRRARVSVLDSQLPALFEAGVDEDVTFQLEPGGYWIREVVTDSEDHQMTATSYNVKIP